MELVASGHLLFEMTRGPIVAKDRQMCQCGCLQEVYGQRIVQLHIHQEDIRPRGVPTVERTGWFLYSCYVSMTAEAKAPRVQELRRRRGLRDL